MGVLLFQETPILGGWVYHHPWVGSEACLLPMGLTSENVAAAYGIPRDRQDSMAADSHKKVGLKELLIDILEEQGLKILRRYRKI